MTQSTHNKIEQLKSLEELRQSGAISQEEFDTLKAEILGQLPQPSKDVTPEASLPLDVPSEVEPEPPNESTTPPEVEQPAEEDEEDEEAAPQHAQIVPRDLNFFEVLLRRLETPTRPLSPQSLDRLLRTLPVPNRSQSEKNAVTHSPANARLPCLVAPYDAMHNANTRHPNDYKCSRTPQG